MEIIRKSITDGIDYNVWSGHKLPWGSQWLEQAGASVEFFIRENTRNFASWAVCSLTPRKTFMTLPTSHIQKSFESDATALKIYCYAKNAMCILIHLHCIHIFRHLCYSIGTHTVPTATDSIAKAVTNLILLINRSNGTNSSQIVRNTQFLYYQRHFERAVRPGSPSNAHLVLGQRHISLPPASAGSKHGRLWRLHLWNEKGRWYDNSISCGQFLATSIKSAAKVISDNRATYVITNMINHLQKFRM